MSDKRFYNIDDLTSLPKPVWAVEGVFECGSLTMLAGPPGSYKSFMALDWILCMATAIDWNGRHVTPAPVLYVLGEGKASLLKRINAWKIFHRLTAEQEKLLNDNFRVTFDVPQMTHKSSVDNLLAGLEEINYSPRAMVVDTFARSAVGVDENSQKDTGMWVDQADRLRNLGYTIIFLHHTAKNTEFGYRYRGSSALMGAVDTGIVMYEEKRGAVKFKIDKQKDHDSGEPMLFKPNPIIAGGDDSCVLVPSVQMDERFSPEGKAIDKFIDECLNSSEVKSSWGWAEVIATRFGISTSAAQSRYSRRARAAGLTEDRNEAYAEPQATRGDRRRSDQILPHDKLLIEKVVAGAEA